MGKIVQATTRRVQNHRIIYALESGLTGIILKYELFDDLDIDPVEKIAEGSILTCWVKTMTTVKYLVELTCKESSLKNDNYQGEQDKDKEVKDPYFTEEDSISRSEQENETIKFLTDKEPRESIIRPSLKGPTHLILTLNIFNGVYAHRDIVEGGKDQKDFASYLRLGKYF